MTEMSTLGKGSDDAARLVEAAREALTDGMVERLADTLGGGLELLDRLNEEDTKDAVNKALDRLVEANQVGALDTLFDLVMVVHGARSAATDSMVERFFVFIEHMMNNLANEELAVMAHNARRAMEEAVDDNAGKVAQGGMFSTLAMLSKPETQQALQFLLSFACRMQQRTEGQRGRPELEEGPHKV